MGKTKISSLGEFGLIEHLTKVFKTKDPSVVRAFGDDTAFVDFSKLSSSLKGGFLLFTVDTLVEGRHFLRWYPPDSVGWKLVSVNVSDIAAKGGRPLFGMITLALPKDIELSYVEELYKGINQALDFYNFDLLGGNTTSSNLIMLDFPTVGHAKRLVFRDKSRVGDYIYVSPYLGDSLAGLELLLERKRNYKPYEQRLIEKHLRPTARLDLAPVVEKYATASMDISDGFISDLRKMLKNLSAEIYLEEIPLSEELKTYCLQRKKDPLYYALKGGEDYQLLITSKEDLTKFGLKKVGKITAPDGGKIIDARSGKVISIEGFDHLRV